MADFPASEHDGDFDLVALLQETSHLARLCEEVPRTDLRAVLHLLDACVGRLLAGLLGLLGRLVLETVVVHDPADRWVGVRSHLDKVKVKLAGKDQRVRKSLDPELFAIGIYQAYFPGADALVYPVFAQVCCSGYSLFSLLRPQAWLHEPTSSGAVTKLMDGNDLVPKGSERVEARLGTNQPGPKDAGGAARQRGRAVSRPPRTRPA